MRDGSHFTPFLEALRSIHEILSFGRTAEPHFTSSASIEKPLQSKPQAVTKASTMAPTPQLVTPRGTTKTIVPSDVGTASEYKETSVTKGGMSQVNSMQQLVMLSEREGIKSEQAMSQASNK